MSILQISQLTKYFGGLCAIKNVTAHVEAGEILGMIGPNGAGKTTLFNLISGSYQADYGSILFEGAHIERSADHQICQKGICRTYQIVKPFNELTVLENVLIGAFKKIDGMKAAREFAMETLHFVGLDKRWDVAAKRLTLAEKKSLELARALATQPKVMLLDEVMAGLNPNEQTEAIELILKINKKGVALVVIEHKMKIMMSISHRIVVLQFGEKIAEGSPEQIANDPTVIEAYLGEKEKIA